MAGLAGRWVQDAPFTNMEGILDAAGVTDPQIRGMILSIKPEIELCESGGTWDYKMITPHGTRAVTFTSGDTVDYVSIVGRPVKATITVEGPRLIEVHHDPSCPDLVSQITRDVNGDQMVSVFKVKDAECVGKYKRVA